MRVARNIVRFWVDFIIGDAWEVAVGVGFSILAIAFLVDRYGAATWLAFILFASVLIFSWLAILRSTSGKRA